jgi:diacylglycerol kinase family enzyme
MPKNGLPSSLDVDRSYAVLLNASARRVTERVIQQVSDIVPPGHLFISRSEEEGRELTGRVLGGGYATVFAGGGDGTLVKFLNDAFAWGERTGQALPDIGVLRLGTGNAIAEMVSSGDFLTDLSLYIRHHHRDFHVLPLVESEGRRFPFAGIGWDAELLNDYIQLKQTVGDSAFKPLVQNVSGYFAALAGLTIPRKVAGIGRERVRIQVTNTGAEAYRVDSVGRTVEVFPPGATLFEGPANGMMAGTCPYYGYGLKVLPFATQRPDRMHLRVVEMSMPKALIHLPEIWKGRYKGDGLLDFLVSSIHVEASRDVPYQESGDGLGRRRSLDLALSKARVQLLRFI